jgi:hypothetical protein
LRQFRTGRLCGADRKRFAQLFAITGHNHGVTSVPEAPA